MWGLRGLINRKDNFPKQLAEWFLQVVKRVSRIHHRGVRPGRSSSARPLQRIRAEGQNEAFHSRILSKSDAWIGFRGRFRGRTQGSDSGVGFSGRIQGSDSGIGLGEPILGSDPGVGFRDRLQESDSGIIQMSRIRMGRIQESDSGIGFR